MVILNLSLDDVGNCEEATTFVKNGILNLAYIQRLAFEKSKELDKIRASRICKSTRKVVINFKHQFNYFNVWIRSV